MKNKYTYLHSMTIVHALYISGSQTLHVDFKHHTKKFRE